jgi:glycosyltransferase involved in cell wall biosynthesis
LLATCIITNFNYGRYLPQAIDSILSQTRPFDEIIIVDDGSTDDSPEVLSSLSKRIEALKVFRLKENRGQLAAFETGIGQSNGEIIFFLDADDVYSQNYLATALDVYSNAPQCDFLFCRYEQFSNRSTLNRFVLPNYESKPEVTDLGLTVVRTYERKAFIGAPTSCLSLRRTVAMRLFPLPLHEDWRSRADDCLVFGASLAGARKFRIECELVGYRVHGTNAFAYNLGMGKPDTFFLRQIALLRLFNFFRLKFYLDERELGRLAHLEFKTIPKPSKIDLCEYMWYVLKNGAKDAGRLHGIALLVKYYFNSKLAPRA